MGPLHEEQQPQQPPSSEEDETARTAAAAVRFGEAPRVQVHRYDHPGDGGGEASSSDELWFTEQEYADMKSQSRRAAREWRRRGCAVLLQDAYSSLSTTTNDQQQQQQEDLLTAFCRLDGPHWHRRGLERHCCPRHGEQRSAAKERARRAVFRAQRQARQEQQQQQQEEEEASLVKQQQQQQRAEDRTAERIAAAYAQECREAKLFARRLGRADERVALEVLLVPPPGDRVVESVRLLGSVPQLRLAGGSSNPSVHSSGSVDSRRVAAHRHHRQQWTTTSNDSRNNNLKNFSSRQPPRSPPKGSRGRNSSSQHRCACPKSPDSTVEELYYAAIA